MADAEADLDPALEPGERAWHEKRARRGAWLIGLGIAGILWGVFHLLAAVPRPEQRDFAHRRPYNEVKVALQGAFLGTVVRSLLGLAIAIYGGTTRSRSLRRLGRGD